MFKRYPFLYLSLLILVTVAVLLLIFVLVWKAESGYILLGTHKGEQGSSYYTIEPNGTHLALIHQVAHANAMPVLSPDGQKIIFNNGERTPLSVMDLEGTNLITLTQGQGLEPAWSPNGQQIAFAAGGLFYDDSLYVVNVDGSNLTRLTHEGITGIESIQWWAHPNLFTRLGIFWRSS